MRLSLIINIFLLCVCIGSCSYHGFYYENRRNYVFQEAYSNDSLELGDYILFGTYRRKGLDYGNVTLNNDSLFTIFKKSINKTGLTICFGDKGKNLSNKKIIERYHSRAKHISPEDINVYANIKDNPNSKRIIIPVIKFNFYTDRTTTGSGGDYITHLSLAIYVLEKNNVVYYKKMRHMEKQHDLSAHLNDFQVPILQEKWDKLVLDVMKEYIERLE